MKLRYKDFFFDKEEFALQCATVSFLKQQRQKLDDVLIDLWNECDGDDFKLALEYPELCDDAVRLDKRIESELNGLIKMARKK